jgi:AcrR family transcriptional regulator
MTRLANTKAREYRSQLRAEQAEETRARILDATIRVIARGIASVSIPAVAREAGVSVPTVYRHFATKADLLAAVHPHVMRRTAFKLPPPPRSLAELRDGVRSYLDHLDSLDEVDRAAMASPGAEEVRRLSIPNRLAVFGELADSIEPKLGQADRDRVTRLLVILTSSSALRMLRDHLGLSAEQTVDDVEWLVRAAIGAATRRTRR